jgi:hypothetical protein
MSDQSRGLHTLRKLKTMRISVAMDDFGIGYSSLATLHAFPFDKIELDQTFVKRLPNDAAAAAIVRTVLATLRPSRRRSPRSRRSHCSSNKQRTGPPRIKRRRGVNRSAGRRYRLVDDQVCWIADSSQPPPRGRKKVQTSVTSEGWSLPATSRPVPRSMVLSTSENRIATLA